MKLDSFSLTHGPDNRFRYFQDSASRRYQDHDRNVPTKSNRNNETEGFLRLGEGDPGASLTASDLLRVLSRVGVLRI